MKTIVETGVGYASFKSGSVRDYWALGTRVNAPHYKARHHYFSGHACYSQISAGMNFKDDVCWFTVDYLFGKNVDYLNSVINPRQFYNNYTQPYNTNSPAALPVSSP